ncbi:MAG: hypothetical protein ACR2JG_07135 [Geodermatophilaceae bacterium]
MSEQAGAIEPSGAKDAGPAKDEDLIESEPSSPRTSELRRRLDILVPTTVGRRVLVSVAAAVLVLGLVAGFLVGTLSGTEPTGALALQSRGAPEGRYLPIVPEVALEEEAEAVIAVAFARGFLTLLDLEELGEAVQSERYGLADPSGLKGLCGLESRPESGQVPQGPSGNVTVFSSVSFELADATVNERIGPDLDVLAASTLRGTVQLAQSCPVDTGTAAQTDGIQTGIGDEYAVFTVRRTDPVPGNIGTSIVVLVRVGGQLIELTLSPEGGPEVPDGLTRALRIAEVAVTRMLAG